MTQKSFELLSTTVLLLSQLILPTDLIMQRSVLTTFDERFPDILLLCPSAEKTKEIWSTRVRIPVSMGEDYNRSSR